MCAVSLVFPTVHLRLGQWLMLRLEQTEARAAVSSAIWWRWLSRRVILSRDSCLRCVAEQRATINSKVGVEKVLMLSRDDKKALGQLRMNTKLNVVAVPI